MDDTVWITIFGMALAAIPNVIAALVWAYLALRAKTAAEQAAAISQITKDTVDGHVDQMMQNARTAGQALGRTEALTAMQRTPPPHEEQH